MKKYLVFGAVLAISILAVLDFKEEKRDQESVRRRPRGSEVRRHARAGAGVWEIPGRASPRSPTLASVGLVDSAVEIADRYLKDHSEKIGLKPYHELRPSVFQTPLGARVNYQVYQDGLPVVGLELRLQIGKEKDVIDLDNRYVPVERVELRESDYLDRSQLQDLIRSSNYLPDPSRGTEPARVLFPVPGSNQAQLAYVVTAREPTGSRQPVQILLRATDGQVLGKSFSRGETRPPPMLKR